jgi:riboflavin kinase/FMN adenylyltransferase
LLREELRRAILESTRDASTPTGAAPSRGHALTLGVFDGVHRGHQMLVERLRDEAHARGLGSGIVTFHPAPVTVLRPDVSFHYLTSLETRVELLRETRVDFVSVVQFTSELAQVSAEDFARVLVEEANMRVLVMGADFAFGRGREGTVQYLTNIGAALGFEVVPIELLAASDDRVSSTRVRQELAAGALGRVRELLGRPYSLRGPVLHGEERGRTIGFPTLNVGISADFTLPPNGVYITRCEIGGHSYASCTNIGTQPTFDGAQQRVETHLLDFEGDLYGEVAKVDLLKRVRDEVKFSGPDELIEQLRRDVEATRAYFVAQPSERTEMSTSG